MERIIFHVDVNNAFLSWSAVEMLKNGSKIDIRTIPSVVGGDEKKRRGVVVARSFPAKKAGIKAGETIYMARRKVDKLFVVKSDKEKYKKYSDDFYNILCKYTPVIERYSIDECFMDMTGMETLFGDPVKLAYKIKDEIYDSLGFTVNVGIGNSKICAKMASDFEKPNKVHTLYQEEIETKMWILPVSELFMVGRRSLPKLQKMGIKTIGDLAKSDEKLLIKNFGKYGKMIWEYSNGIDNEEVNYIKEKPKNIGNSITLPYDYNNIEKIEEVLLALVEQVSYRLRNQEMFANVVNIQIKTNEFKFFSHQRKLDFATDSTKIIGKEAKKLLTEIYNNTPIRLIGVSVSGLVEKEERQISLFENIENEKQKKIDSVLDNIKEKYGYEAITRAGKMQIDKNIKFKEEK